MSLSPIKVARMREGLRQIDVAREVGVSESQLSKIETGRVEPDEALLRKIAGALGVRPEDLRSVDAR